MDVDVGGKGFMGQDTYNVGVEEYIIEEDADEEYEEYNEVNEEFLFDADNVELQEVREDLKNLQKERLVL